ncbi:hypothetical protein I7V28_19145 [Lelliottia amnigena]|jgi:hypothetical protein|uniref:hypothetical protein n=1 Tax=Lelliottia TaxID=1330545 RepID=UPI00192C8897|nr:MULTISPECIES: hypothetical protein [Lelliottia]MBL5885621.1 hypothetical protein [Lelliottia aquatilis]MBL5923199.1 hypothetical protein [Lelliottia amnigena]MBL5932109.1 hypothetical protein [Lelliottia amnigena]
MHIEHVVNFLGILSTWLEDNINCDSDLIFDNDVDNTTSEDIYPAVVTAQAILARVNSLSGGDVTACFQSLQNAVDSHGALLPEDVATLLAATRLLVLSAQEQEHAA